MSAIEPIYRSLGRRIQTARRQHQPRLSQEEVAERVGLPRSAISAIESGRQRILTHSLIRLCEVLEVKPNDLLLGLEDKLTVLNIKQADSDINQADKIDIGKMVSIAKTRMNDRE